MAQKSISKEAKTSEQQILHNDDIDDEYKAIESNAPEDDDNSDESPQ